MLGVSPNLNLPFNKISAIDGKEILTKELQNYQQQSWLHYTALNAGKIGCALSWHKAWKPGL